MRTVPILNQPHRIVIIGGGFGGLEAARRLRHAPVELTLVDRRNFHLFQPLLYQVAIGGLSPANIAAPLRGVLKRQKNVRVLLAEVVDFDVADHRVVLRDGAVEYDTLIVAAGVRHHYFGHPEWEAIAPGLKTVEDATAIRRRILLAFEEAERTTDPATQQALMTFVIVGAGPTGVELAGAIGELAHHTLRQNFRSIDPAKARILLVEGADRVLPPFTPKMSAKAEKALGRLGVTVRAKTLVTDVQRDSVTVKCGESTERIPTHTVLWAAGVQGSPLGKALAAATGVSLDRAGRVKVEPDLSVPNHPNIFVIGDLAYFEDEIGQPLPGVAPVAIQQGRYVTKLISKRLRNEALSPFQYKDPGKLATIGRNAAVAEFGRIRLSGWFAWCAWLFIHLMNIVHFENRVLVLAQWAWNYWTRNRSARLITGEPAHPEAKQRS
jgi:NADH:ubiquinone reductase (H+-translocating)